MPWRKVASDGMPIGVVRFSGGLSNLGNTAGTTGTVQNNLVLAATGQYSLSQSQSSTGATVTLAGDGYMSRYGVNTAGFYASTTASLGNAAMWVIGFDLPYQLSFSAIDVPMSVSLATSAVDATAQMNLTAMGVLYTRSTNSYDGGVLIPIRGLTSQTTYTWDSNSGVYSSLTGPRIMSFAIGTSLSAGQYYFGFVISSVSTQVTVGSATTALNASFNLVGANATSYFDMSGVAANSGLLGLPNIAYKINARSDTFTASAMAIPAMTFQGIVPIVILRNI